MDAGYKLTGAYVPYYPNGGFLTAGSPSPPMSLCSEPIVQLPMPDVRTGSPGLQLKSPRIQLLNKTLVDARKKKNVVRGPTPCVQPPDMENFFPNMLHFSDQSSDKGDGSIKGGPESPQFRYSSSPFFIPSSPLHWQPLDSPLQYPQIEQRQLNIIPVEKPRITNFPVQQQPKNVGPPVCTWLKTARPMAPDNEVKAIKKQTPKGKDPPISSKTKTKNVKNDAKPKLKPNPKPKQKQKPKPKLSSTRKKSSLISTNASNKERAKHNLMLRKQRKRVQQKNKSLHKTELCTHWMLTSNCTFKGKCYFAHGIEELRNRTRLSNYKTKPCVDCPSRNGRCLFASRCNYCHPGEAIRRPVSKTYFDIDYYNDLKKEFKDNEYPFGIFI